MNEQGARRATSALRVGAPLAIMALMLAFVIAGLASSAAADRRRPTVREIDLLMALIDAEVPVDVWAVVDVPYDRYRTAVRERAAAWDRQPPLQRPIDRPSEIDSLRREQRRRAEQLRGDQRTLLAELRGALLEHATQHGRVEVAYVDDLTLWLEARMAARVAAAHHDGSYVRAPLPSIVDMRLSTIERRELVAELRPHLRPYIDAAERFLDAHLRRSPAVLPTNEQFHVLPEFVTDDLMVAAEAARAAAVPLARASAALHREALRTVPDHARDRLIRSAFDQLEPNAHMVRTHMAARLIAERLDGLDDEGRTRLVAARARLEAALADERARAMTDLAEFDEDTDLYRSGAHDFFARMIELDAAWRDEAQAVLGDRLTPLLRLDFTTIDAAEQLRSLVAAEATAELLAIDEPDWQIRQLERRRQSPVEWRSIVDAVPVSDSLTRRLAAVAAHDAEISARLDAAVADHARRWAESIEPLQRHAREALSAVARLTVDDDAARPIGTAWSALETLRGTVADLEESLAAAIRGAGGDRFLAERWLLDRAIESSSPRDGGDRFLNMSVLASAPTIDEIIEDARLSPIDADVARGVGYAGAPSLVAALRSRHTALEGLRLWRWRQQALFMATSSLPIGAVGRREAAASLDDIARRVGIDPFDPESALVEAWDSIFDDWSVAVPESVDALRHAWALRLHPGLANDALPIDAYLTRLGDRLRRSDPARADRLAALAEEHRRDRDLRVATSAEERVRLPHSMQRWSLDRQIGERPDARTVLGIRFERDDREAVARTLRRAVAIIGTDDALDDAATIALLRRAELERLW